MATSSRDEAIVDLDYLKRPMTGRLEKKDK
jgi:hypothetical protein